LLEKQGFGFFGLKTHIDSKYLEKHQKHFDEPIYGLNKTKKWLKNQNQSEPKNILLVRFASSSKEKKKKHLGKTTLVKWNPLTLISTFWWLESLLITIFSF